MESVILVIHLMLALAIIVVVLLQPSESGDGLTGGGGGVNAGIAAPRRTGNAMTKATAIMATGFFITSLSLSILAGHKPEQKSILDHAQSDTSATATVPTVVETRDEAIVADDAENDASQNADTVKEDVKSQSPKPPISK